MKKEAMKVKERSVIKTWNGKKKSKLNSYREKEIRERARKER